MKKNLWANVALCLLILLAVGYGLRKIAEAPDLVSLLKPEAEVDSSVRSLGEALHLDDYEFEFNQVTNEVAADFRISNGSEQPVRDIVIHCDMLDKRGDYRGSGRWVIYEIVSPAASEHFTIRDKRYVSHLVTPETVECRIIKIDVGDTRVASSDGH